MLSARPEWQRAVLPLLECRQLEGALGDERPERAGLPIGLAPFAPSNVHKPVFDFNDRRGNNERSNHNEFPSESPDLTPEEGNSSPGSSRIFSVNPLNLQHMLWLAAETLGRLQFVAVSV